MSKSAWPLPLWIAHRGAGKLAPENTLAAFRLGAAHGYRAFECDVKLSSDGVPFLLHDATLERTTSAEGPAGTRTWAELSQLDAGGWHSRAYAGEPPPTLAAIATYLRRNGFALDLEIKPSPGTEQATGEAVGRACLALWGQNGDPAAPLVFSSFRPEALFGAMQTAPQIPRALLLDTLWDGWERVADALAAVAIITNHTLMDTALIGRIHGQGRRALVYTVNEAERARELIALGIDGIVTDAVDRFAPAVSAA